MADLMSGSYSYDKLAKQYSNFIVPLVKIKTNGMDQVEKLKLSVYSLRATLSLEGASMVVIKLAGLYDEKNHAFSSKAKSAFPIGTVVTVELGYQSSSTQIFKGFVAMRGAEFGTRTPFLVLTLMDARRLMMLTGQQYKLHTQKNYSDIVKEILGSYSKLCTPSIDSTTDDLKDPVSQTKDDYHFITGDLIRKGRADREFFILSDKAYFRTPRKAKTAIMTLQYGRELIALKTDEGYRDAKIEVTGSDEENQKSIKGNSSVKKASGQKSILSKTPEIFLADALSNTQKKATDKAKAIADRQTWQAQTGMAITVGLPELVPGRYVKVEKLDKDLCDHKFYIKSVVHEIDSEEFRTMLELEGWD